MTAKIFLMRHALSTCNAEQRFCGQHDCCVVGFELMPIPEISCSKGFDVICSPLQRCRDTLLLLQKITIVKNVNYDPRLSERSMGIFNGKKKTCVYSLLGKHALFAWRHNDTVKISDAENLQAFYTRVRDAWLFWRSCAMRKPTIIISHQGVLRCIHQIEKHTSSFQKYHNGEIRMLELSSSASERQDI